MNCNCLHQDRSRLLWNAVHATSGFQERVRHQGLLHPLMKYSRPSPIRPLGYPTFRIKRKWRQIHLLRKLRHLTQGKIYKIVKILGRMNSRTVMMERFQDAEFSWHCCPQKTVTIPRSVCVLYLLFTQLSLILSFHSSDSVSCPKGVGYARVYCKCTRYIRIRKGYSHRNEEGTGPGGTCSHTIHAMMMNLFSHVKCSSLMGHTRKREDKKKRNKRNDNKRTHTQKKNLRYMLSQCTCWQ